MFNDTLLGNISNAIHQVTSSPALKVDQVLEVVQSMAFDTKSAAEKVVKEVKETVSSLDSTVSNVANLEASVVECKASSMKQLEALPVVLADTAATIATQLRQWNEDKAKRTASFAQTLNKLSGVADTLVARQVHLSVWEGVAADQEKTSMERSARLEASRRQLEASLKVEIERMGPDVSPICYFSYPAAPTNDSPASFFAAVTPPEQKTTIFAASTTGQSQVMVSGPPPYTVTSSAAPLKESSSAAPLKESSSAALLKESPAVPLVASAWVIDVAAAKPPAAAPGDEALTLQPLSPMAETSASAGVHTDNIAPSSQSSKRLSESSQSTSHPAGKSFMRDFRNGMELLDQVARRLAKVMMMTATPTRRSIGLTTRLRPPGS